jgi:RNA-directed DNA polymerase
MRFVNNSNLTEQDQQNLFSILSSQSSPRKKKITSKQLSYFSAAFTTDEKRRKRYTRFFIKKKSGKSREILAPIPKLKLIQRCINVMLYSVYIPQESAYGFVPGKSIFDNAKVHAGSAFVYNIDVQDFFPSIYFKRVKKVLELPPFNLTGEREPIAFMIANLCSENGVLPQGAPTSPFLTNIICQRLDRRLSEFAKKLNARYSRYADDITFSSNDFVFTKRFRDKLEKILMDERFTINPEKTRIQGKAYRQEVTGLTVNEKVNINRRFYRKYRTLVHLFKTKGPEAALGYHLMRMPLNLLSARSHKMDISVDDYIRSVILGKYLFIKMIKGTDAVKPPFEIKPGKTRGIALGEALVRLDLKSISGNLKISNEEEKGQSGEESKIKTNITQSDFPIDEILDIWEADGFEKAIDQFKQLDNEQ